MLLAERARSREGGDGNVVTGNAIGARRAYEIGLINQRACRRRANF